MFDHILHNSYPRQWRTILRALSFTSILLVIGFAAISLYLALGVGDHLPLYVMFIFLIPGYIAHLLRSAISESSEDANSMAFATMMLVCAIIVFSAFGIVFEHFKEIERKAEIRWAISNTCSADGEFRSEIVSECIFLASQFKMGICPLGADPMHPCELALRERLDRPLESERQILVVE